MLKRRLGEYRGRSWKAYARGHRIVDTIADHTGTASVVSDGMPALYAPHPR